MGVTAHSGTLLVGTKGIPHLWYMLAKFYDHITDHRNRWQLWFWVILFLQAPVGAALGNGQTFGESIFFRTIGLVSKMTAAYFMAYYLFPKVLFRKKYWLFIAWLPIMAYGISVLARTLNIYVCEAILYPNLPNENLLEIILNPVATMDLYLGRFLPFTFWFVFIKIGVDQLRSQQKLAKLEQEKTAAELSFLKAQIHPHFLFNTLNNLYTLTLEKSDEAPEVVIKLSEMLDYLLYHCQAPKVPISREIALIDNYLGLERLRYGERLQLTFHHEIDKLATMISPLILLSPVENAFKHGVSGIAERTLIRIKLTVREGELHFQVWNTKPPTPPVDEREYTKGIGLKNVRSQLALTYPDRHEMLITDTAEDYTVDLHIKL